jgi:hypothetical protein
MGIEIPLPKGLSLRINDNPGQGNDYSTGRLQKGFLLLDYGQILAEEAVGFGVPVLKRGLQTIFPGSLSMTWVQNESNWEIPVIYNLNLEEKIYRSKQNEIQNRLFYVIKNSFASLIRTQSISRKLLTATSSKLREIFDWETRYTEANFATQIKMTYLVESKNGKLSVNLDTSHLPSGVTEIIIMNEQGAHYFDQYLDTAGTFLHGEDIGCWDRVIAAEAFFRSTSHNIVFKLTQVKDCQLYRGRELIDPRLAWAGFGYSIPPSKKKFEYDIWIERTK